MTASGPTLPRTVGRGRRRRRGHGCLPFGLAHARLRKGQGRLPARAPRRSRPAATSWKAPSRRGSNSFTTPMQLAVRAQGRRLSPYSAWRRPRWAIPILSRRPAPARCAVAGSEHDIDCGHGHRGGRSAEPRCDALDQLGQLMARRQGAHRLGDHVAPSRSRRFLPRATAPSAARPSSWPCRATRHALIVVFIFIFAASLPITVGIAGLVEGVDPTALC